MQRSTKSSIGTLLILALAGILATTPLASAQSINGSFNPQTQFPIGSTVTVNSVYGLGGGPFFNPAIIGEVNGNWASGQNNQGNWAQGNQSRAFDWNQASPPSFNTSLTLTAQVTNYTANGALMWTIESGSIIENGTILTITSGNGGIGKLDRILIGGNATGPDGHTYRWVLEGLAAMYNGTVIASLTGASSYNPNPATPPNQQFFGNNRPRGASLSFIITVT